MSVASRSILGMRTDATSYMELTQRVLEWTDTRESKYVCIANVHMTMESHDSPTFRQVVNGADVVTPDGMPLVWALRLLGSRHASQVRGPTLILHLLERAATTNTPVGFFGATPEVLRLVRAVCAERFPGLLIAYEHAPPFRPLTAAEDEAVVQAINDSGAKILFVGLGCPKQERWMAAHRGSVQAVMLGVGAAVDFLAGTKPEAPAWMQRSGLEWTYRLASEPRRLWRRYAYHNPRFVALMLSQYLKTVTE